jgi:hypothetical protein
VDTGVGHQVGLELRDIHVECAIETKGSSQGRDDLSDETIEVGVRRPLNVKIPFADIVKSFVVEAEGTIRVLKKGMSGKDRVIRLHNSRRHLGRRRNSKGELGLASIVHRKPLKEKRSKTGPSSTSSGMEHEETLETGTVVG